MMLFKNNIVADMWVKDDDDLLYEFAASDVYQDKSRDEKVRLAFFLTYKEPNGLQSTFYGCQFNKLWDYWCANKFQFTMNNVQCTINAKGS